MDMLNKVQGSFLFIGAFSPILASSTLSAGRDNSASVQELFEKEAVYRAVGLAAYELYDEIDYDKWYSTQLIRELEITDQRYVHSESLVLSFHVHM